MRILITEDQLEKIKHMTPDKIRRSRYEESDFTRIG